MYDSLKILNEYEIISTELTTDATYFSVHNTACI